MEYTRRGEQGSSFNPPPPPPTHTRSKMQESCDRAGIDWHDGVTARVTAVNLATTKWWAHLIPVVLQFLIFDSQLTFQQTRDTAPMMPQCQFTVCDALISTSRVLYSAQYYRQHCTLQAFEQFGALYMHSHDDKHPARPGFEPCTTRVEAPVDTNEPSGPATNRR